MARRAMEGGAWGWLAAEAPVRAGALMLDHSGRAQRRYSRMSVPDQEQPEIETKDGKLVYGGRTWSPFGFSVTFVAASLAIGHDRDSYGGPETKVSLNGEAYIECEGLVVVGRHRDGVRVVSFGISPQSVDWLAEDIEGVARPISDKLPSRVHLGHSAPDDALEVREEFYVSVYIPRDLFDAIVEKVRERTLESLRFRAEFVGLYADFRYGQARHTRLGLAPGRYGGELARGRLNNIQWQERPVAFAKPHWLAGRLFPNAKPEIPKEGKPSDVVTESDPSSPAPSLARVEGLLSQIAVAARWIGWGLLALTVVVALHLR